MHHCEDRACVDTRTKLLLAAREAFVAEGYRASVDGIAARAGVAKQTLYNHFPSKEELFIEVVSLGSASIVVMLDGAGDDLRRSLLHFAKSFRQRALEDDSLAMLRILTAEINRLPELTQAFFTKGPGQTLERLAEFLSAAMTKGELRREAPRFAAEMLIGMLLNIDFVRCQCAISINESSETKRCEQIVDCFLRAFAPQV